MKFCFTKFNFKIVFSESIFGSIKRFLTGDVMSQVPPQLSSLASNPITGAGQYFGASPLKDGGFVSAYENAEYGFEASKKNGVFSGIQLRYS